MVGAILDAIAESGMRLKPDRRLRDRFFTDGSYSHPAQVKERGHAYGSDL